MLTYRRKLLVQALHHSNLKDTMPPLSLLMFVDLDLNKIILFRVIKNQLAKNKLPTAPRFKITPCSIISWKGVNNILQQHHPLAVDIQQQILEKVKQELLFDDRLLFDVQCVGTHKIFLSNLINNSLNNHNHRAETEFESLAPMGWGTASASIRHVI